MKFFDKVKDLFTDEEEIEEKIEINDDDIIKKNLEDEHQLPTFMRNKLAEEKKNEESNKKNDYFKIKNEIDSVDNDFLKSRSSKSFSFPVDIDDNEDYQLKAKSLDDNHFNENNSVENKKKYYEEQGFTLRENRKEEIYQKQNVLLKEKKVTQLYPEKEDKPKKFKPTPVISPIYGVLDKNYTKDDVKVTDSNSYAIQRPSRKVDFETVRNKAFGTVSEELRDKLCGNCELYQEVKITKAVEIKDDNDLLSDLKEESYKSDISVGDAEDNYYDYGVDYVPPRRVTPLNDSNNVKIINHNEEESVAEKIEVNDSLMDLNISDKLSDTKEFDKILSEEETSDMILNNLSDIGNNNDNNDIFNLIDSMYEEDEK